MLNNITWQGYWIAIAFTTAFYYSLIFLLFYRKGWVQKLRPWLSPAPAEMPDAQSESLQLIQHPSSPNALQEEDPEYLPAVHSLVDEVHAFFDSTDTATDTKHPLLTALKQIIQKYPSVKGTAYQYSVTNLIVFRVEQYRSIHLSAEEVGSLWG